jgi:signal transduction histidine kinase
MSRTASGALPSPSSTHRRRRNRATAGSGSSRATGSASSRARRGLRIASEALRNAQHAASAQIEVEIVYDRQQFRLRVRDDGRGIDPRLLAQGREGHFGLAGMHERAAVVGGKLTVWSALDAGTEIELTGSGVECVRRNVSRCRRGFEYLVSAR